MTRSSGVLLHITSLAGPYGIGDLGEQAFKFVDFLVATKQTYWQVLPLGPTSLGDSPYQSVSAFAGNTHFISFDKLIERHWLDPQFIIDEIKNSPYDRVDYALNFRARRIILERAVQEFIHRGHLADASFKAFVAENHDWLIPYCQYMTLKEYFDLKPWYEWPDEYRYYDSNHVATFCEEHQANYHYHLVTQYWFNDQWQTLKAYANQNHIEIIGDMPIYVSRDSVEMWQKPQMFKVDGELNPTCVAGTPPDAFTEDGQYWGNPIYDWHYMKKDHYRWWIDRIRMGFKLYDMIRIDHFRGFESYWEVPNHATTAAEGKWVPGPGIELFKAIKNALGTLKIIAEDLGVITDEVVALREATGFPGMRILQFGFDGKNDSDYLPHNYEKNSIAYVGTHDNETARGWYDHTASQLQRDQVDHYLNRQYGESASHALNRGIASSVSDIVIYTMQDLLDLDNRARMNTPATIGINWLWRMSPNSLTPHLQKELLDLTETYYRCNPKL